jgi:Zn-dependent peptidase ImmA (M78 family)/transcriptional regulator with XRE-family HTH domain
VSFNSARLRIARLFKGYTQRELADRVAVSNALIGEYEKGRREPKGDILDALAVVLDVDSAFFFRHDEDEFREEETNFRRRITATERLKKKVLAQASMFGIVVRYLAQFVRFPSFNVPSLPASSLDDVERVAEQCRQHWGLGLDAPIGSMARVLENAGVVLVRADFETATKVDAFSRFGDVSVVVLNTEKGSASRTMFDTAHETGHGVLHRNARGLPLDRREAEADRFASAFLLPRDAFTEDYFAGGRGDWSYLFELKRRWGVSLQAIIHRAFDLRLIDAAEYRHRFRYISKRGWRSSEPDEPEPDEPELFRLALERFALDTGRTTGDLARELGMSRDLFQLVTGVMAESPSDPSIFALDQYRQRRIATG